MNEKPKTVRCAIYVRKSREEGLEQEFNSLDAQREAALAFIATQKCNGWRPIEKEYADGGFTGANTDRPALQELMKDIEAGAVDVVVVYKVDRLSRSLADFADLMKKFESHGVSFVSATQQLDTSSPMGRMVLNILITFAEFERDMIRTRIQDKLAASKKKGLWVGGHVPFGYKVVDHKLVPEPAEVEAVRFLFRRFVECGSATLVAREMNAKGWKTRIGNPWSVQTVRKSLAQHAYIGKVFYKDQVYEGQHEGIVDEALWNEARRIATSDPPLRGRKRIEDAAPLRGILHCKACGCAMQHTYSQKGGRRYAYYVCSKDRKGNAGAGGCPMGRVPAGVLEEAVFGQLGRILQSDAFAEALARECELTREDIRASVADLPAFWDELFPEEKRRLVRLLVARADVGPDAVDIELRTAGFARLAEEMMAQ